MSIDINILITLLDHPIVNFYNTYLLHELKVPFNDYIKSLDLPLDSFYSDIPEYRRFYKKARIKTKINWYDKYMRELATEKTKSVPVLAYRHIQNQSDADAPISWEDYKESFIKKLDRWRTDNDMLLTDFPYMDYCKIKTRELALGKEVALNMIDLLEKKLGVIDKDSDDNNGVILQPLEFLLAPFVSIHSPGVQLQSSDGEVLSKRPLILYDDYTVPYTENQGKLVIRSLVELTDDITEQDTNIRSLSAFDVQVLFYIINYVVEHEYSTFLSTRTFQKYLSEIVKAVFPNDKRPSSRCYSQVKKSLSKLSSISVNGIKNGETVRKIDFFDSYVLFEEDQSKQQLVNLTFGNYLFDRITKQKIQRIYQHEVNKIMDRSSRYVFYVFEYERQKAYASGTIDKEQFYEYTFFMHTMRFPSRSNVKKNMDLIESIFKEFVSENLVFLSYRREVMNFYVKFKPFYDEDIAKLRLDNEQTMQPFFP